ncbi:hypothetical protein QAD02_022505 [Eretmocerus hayati]|uniref:Uncharacterized protein n=1 Tax=Eretmocerus hayati TaxID=131215 RepID=A0ACC2PVA0_9HYME|nr:hypothetical protein QAD02_022505 [Eretmocerus hayati]
MSETSLKKKIEEIPPIDLMIGGSPCNELSSVNPKRRGLDARLRRYVTKHNKGRHFFWLFENVASMTNQSRAKITKYLGREPKAIESVNFSAQHRLRLYWGNVPWGPYENDDVTLQDMLHRHCNRQALVEKIPTVTTKSNSLKQSKH